MITEKKASRSNDKVHCTVACERPRTRSPCAGGKLVVSQLTPSSIHKALQNPRGNAEAALNRLSKIVRTPQHSPRIALPCFQTVDISFFF